MFNPKKLQRKMEAKMNEMNERLLFGNPREPPPEQPPTEHSSAPKIPTIYERVDALENALLEVATMVAEAQND